MLRLSGDPLDSPVDVTQDLFSSLDPNPEETFFASSDGTIDVTITNNAEPSTQGGGGMASASKAY